MPRWRRPSRPTRRRGALRAAARPRGRTRRPIPWRAVLERIAQLRADGEAAVASATTTDELETVRVAHLGRKAELPNLLRGVAQLDPAQRGQVGKAANQARQA